jgi:hypothetical protein
MPLIRVIDTDQSVDEPYSAAVSLEFTTTLVLAAGVLITATGSGAVGISSELSFDFDHSLLIYGRVHSAQGPAIVVSGSVTVGASGSITGAPDGIYLYGANTPGQPHVLNNAGAISGSSMGPASSRFRAMC